ncbi:hypothetical protein [Streptomyces sp. NRRL S-337]|uniref:hypothetical protein n=1 Tax=Streptomyces sp. NRRL S-337 TaxID=1463900 RepID=UPI0004C6EFF4|nr:hypothetical protein [Streptomyces sp. NRRL S-337]
MGYRKQPRRIEISLAGHAEYGDVRATARGMNLADYLELMGYSEGPEVTSKSGIVRQLERFADSLISWNLEEEDGTPTPPTYDEFFALDESLALALATDWIERLGGKVSDPLDATSPDGGPSPEASIPMEPLSANPLPTAVPA